MKIKQTSLRQKERVTVYWRGYGFDRDFHTVEEAEAYKQGLRDAQDAIRVDWLEDEVHNEG